MKSNKILDLASKFELMTKKAKDKAQVRTRPNPTFQSTHPKVNDNRDHYPMDDIDQARNALARMCQHGEAPDWWDGSLEELRNAIRRKVRKEFKSVEVSDKCD